MSEPSTLEDRGRPGDRHSPPPSKASVLISMLNDPATVRELYAWCRRAHPPFPLAGSALFVARTLWRAGYDVPYGGEAERQARVLTRFGWIQLPAGVPPQAGDLYVSIREDTGQVERIGIVAKVHRSGGKVLTDWFMAADNVMGESARPYRRNIGEGEYPRIFCWLRRPG